MSGWRAARARYWADPAQAGSDARLVGLRDLAPEFERIAHERSGPVASGTHLGPGLGLFHDGQPGCVTLGLGEATGTGGLAIATRDFAGSYFSLALDLPAGRPADRQTVVAVWAAVDPPGIAPRLRLNLECGVNTERPDPVLTWLPTGVLAEFDLSVLPPPDPARGWVDLLFPPMRSAALRITALHLAMWRRLEA